MHESILPEPVHFSVLNEYDCVLEISTEFELHKIAVDQQQISQLFVYGIVITCDVVTKEKLNDIEQGREKPSLPQFGYHWKKN